MDFGKILYGKRIDIKCYKEESKKVNTLGPAGLGLSSFRPGSVSSTAAKYSSVASYMDELLVNHSVNALESESSIYVEFTVNGENFAAACDGDTIDWEKESPKGESYMFGLMPLSLERFAHPSIRSVHRWFLRKGFVLLTIDINLSLIHISLQEGIGHCFLLCNDSQGISPKNVPHLGQT